jgi:predicted PurR-regulated permease PerM
MLGLCLYFCRPVLLPVTAAMVVGTTFAPLMKASARRGVPSWLLAGVIALSLVALAGLAVTFFAQPLTDWIARAPEMGAVIKQRLYVLDRPLSALRELQEAFLPLHGKAVAVEQPLAVVTPVITLITPAVIEFVLFFVMLVFFLAVQMDFRRYMATFFTTREGKLRFIRIANDIERRLVSYLVTVTVINFCLGVAVTFGAWLFGLSSPVLFGLAAMVLNYIPYIGAGCMTLLLLAVGLASFSQLAWGIVPAVAFVLLAIVEGQFITPAILGRRLTLNPLAVLLAIAFWSWIWGPMGTFLAVPLTIAGFVTLHHLLPPDESKLPG